MLFSVNCYFQQTIYLFVSINFAKIFNVPVRNKHFHVNACGTMQRSITHNIEMRYVLRGNRNGQLLAKIKTIFPSRDRLSRSGNTSTVKLTVQFSKISLRRARARIHTIFIWSNFPRQVDVSRRDCSTTGEEIPSHSKLKPVESRI